MFEGIVIHFVFVYVVTMTTYSEKLLQDMFEESTAQTLLLFCVCLRSCCGHVCRGKKLLQDMFEGSAA